MYTIHEGEIVIKEKYGSTFTERFYVKPTDQENIVVQENRKVNNVSGWFTTIFLPQGYPDSVSKDYITYQIWDTAQAFCSTITGTLATQEVLRGVGVGDTSATPLAATVTWVIKDGCGHLGKIMFAFSHGTNLDAYSKKWRLYADTMNDAAMCIEIAIPLFKNYTTFALCISTVMKAIVGVTGGATRAAMTQHHAIRGNLADVSAKDSAQETAVNLVASIVALLIITLFGNSLFIFILMMVLHIVFNYFAVRAVCLRTLNEPRLLQVIDRYLKQEVIAAPCEINRSEPIIFYQLGPNLLDLRICGFEIKLGSSIKKFVKQNPKALFLKNVKDVYDDRNYILIPNISKRKMFILLKDEITTDETLCAYFHAVLLSIIICAINDDPLAIDSGNSANPRPFAQVCHTLQSAEWSRETVNISDSFSGFTYNPSFFLMKYVDQIVQKEWQRVRDGLIHTGWDLNKHLLMVDEWRINSGKITTKTIYTDMTNMEPFKDVNPIFKTFSDTIEELDSMKRNENNAFMIEPDTSILKLPQSSKVKLQDAEKESEPKNQKITETKPNEIQQD